MTDALQDLAIALARSAQAARRLVASIALRHGRHLSGTLWRPDVLVASEQALPRGEAFEVTMADARSSSARVIGRDPTTNVAALRLETFADPPPEPNAAVEAQVGSIALAYGADGTGGITSRWGVIQALGPAWTSRAGGRIDRRIVVDVRLSRSEEGGPVLDVAGGCLGITTFAPARRVLVIPSATIDRSVEALLKHGRVARGWLGVALQPVAIPDSLQSGAGQRTGMMVMSLAESGPAATAGMVAGDILVSMNGTPTQRFRSLASQLGPESVGVETEIKVLRAGALVALRATIAARPPS